MQVHRKLKMSLARKTPSEVWPRQRHQRYWHQQARKAAKAMQIVACPVRHSSGPVHLVITEDSLPDRNLYRGKVVTIGVVAYPFFWCVTNGSSFPMTSADEQLIHSEEPDLHRTRRGVDITTSSNDSVHPKLDQSREVFDEGNFIEVASAFPSNCLTCLYRIAKYDTRARFIATRG